MGDRGQANGQGNQARGQGGIPDGLLVGILSDLMYVLVDPRIDFERRAG